VIECLHSQVFADLLQKNGPLWSIFSETSSSLSKKCQFVFAKYSGKNIFKITTSVPTLGMYITLRQSKKRKSCHEEVEACCLDQSKWIITLSKHFRSALRTAKTRIQS
jgi:hypothetical protein